MDNDYLIKKPPLQALFLFALPMIIGNLFQQTYTMVDSAIVGRYVSEQALAAVGASYALTNIFICVAIGGGIGASVIVSRYFGAKEYGRMKTAVFTALLSFLGISLVLGIAGLILGKQIMVWLNTPADCLDMASEYLRIYFLGLPFLFMYNVLSAMFNALGKSRIPLYFLIFSSIFNVILDIIMVTKMDMGVAGVAWATLIAQGVSAVLSFFLLMRKLKGYEEEEKYGCYDFGMMRSMVKIAVPSTLQQSIVHMGILLVQSVVNSFGSAALAGYSAGSRIESLSIVPMLAMGNAMSTFTAQNIGAGKLDRVKEGYKMCYVTVLTVGAGLCIMYQLFGGAFVSMFLESGGSTAYSVGVSYVKFLSFFYAFIGLKATTDGLLRGAGDVAAFTAANLVNLSIRVIVTNVFAPVYGIQVAWMAVPMGWAANYIISFGWYLTGKWKRVKVISADQGEKRKN